MWNCHSLTRIDFRVIPVILSLMIISLLIISSFSELHSPDRIEEGFFTPVVKNQIRWFVMGWGVFLFFAAFDYNKLREWTWALYAIVLVLLVGLFFTGSIVGVNRWYRIPFLNFSAQPSELAKLVECS